METNTSTGLVQRTTAKDFFLHLGTMVGLYASAIAFVNLLFSVINKAYPQITQYYYYNAAPNISFPVATLIIVFPIFILLSWLLGHEYALDPLKKGSWVRRWGIYITLFISGLILVGDLVATLYKFLDGQELTIGFILKALVVLGVTALIFGYYVQDIREKIPSWRKKFWAVFTSIVIIVAIVLGFSVIGSPRTQRLIRYDDQKVQDLQNIQWQIIGYWQRKGSIPTALTDINDPFSSYTLPVDPQTKVAYEYKKTGDLSFELCVEFNRESQNENYLDQNMVTPVEPYGKIENWQHGAGRQCFSRTIDPELYPVTKPVR